MKKRSVQILLGCLILLICLSATLSCAGGHDGTGSVSGTESGASSVTESGQFPGDEESETKQDAASSTLPETTSFTLPPIPPVLGCEHDFRETDSLNPTCEQEGYIVYTCSLCNETIRNTLPKKPHSFLEIPDDAELGHIRLCIECGYYEPVTPLD